MTRISLTELRNKISQVIEGRRYDDAAAMARLILEAYPKSVHAHRLLGEALWENGLPDEAKEAFERVLEYDPEDFVAYAGLGLIAEQAGSLDRAISHLQRAVELAPNSEEVRSELLRLYERKGMSSSAKLKISRAALARIYSRSEMPARAIGEFQAVLDDEPDRLDLRLALAEVLWREGQRDEAKRQAEIVLQYLPEALKAHLILAAVARGEGREQHAEQLLAEAAAIDPTGEYAERLFGTDSPLPPADPLLEVPDYLLGQAAAATSASDAELELPDWLMEGDEAESGRPAEEPAPDAEASAPTEEEASPEPGAEAGIEPGAQEGRPRHLREAASAVAAEEPAGDGAEEPSDELTVAWRKYRSGNLAGALSLYQDLVESEQQVEDVIQALTVIVSDTDDLDATELLGDAHVRAGHFRAALEAYQRVLRRLQD